MLFDPCWNYRPFSEYWSLEPHQWDCDSILDRVDACIISHIHDDHYSEEILRKLKCPIYIMEGRPDLTEKLSEYNGQVYEVDRSQKVSIFQDVWVYFVPHAFNPVDSSCFVSAPDLRFYHGNDNFVSYEQIVEAVRVMGMPDVATVPYAYLNWYPENLLNLSPAEKNQETQRLVRKIADAAIELIRAMQPRRVIPAGANLYYRDEINSPFNAMGITPWHFQRICPPDVADRIICLTAGDYINSRKTLQTRTEREFLQEVKRALKQNKPKNLTAFVELRYEHIPRLRAKVSKARHTVPNHEVLFAVGDKFIAVDLEHLTVELRETDASSKENHVIYIEDYQLMEWLNGHLTYEMVVATRKFKMLRRPNVYNVKVFEFILNYL